MSYPVRHSSSEKEHERELERFRKEGRTKSQGGGKRKKS